MASHCFVSCCYCKPRSFTPDYCNNSLFLHSDLLPFQTVLHVEAKVLYGLMDILLHMYCIPYIGMYAYVCSSLTAFHGIPFTQSGSYPESLQCICTLCESSLLLGPSLLSWIPPNSAPYFEGSVSVPCLENILASIPSCVCLPAALQCFSLRCKP